MTMQRKHYNAIAAALYSGEAQVQLVHSIAEELAHANSKFDMAKFVLKATDGPSMEKRAAQYRTHLKRTIVWAMNSRRVVQCPWPMQLGDEGPARTLNTKARRLAKPNGERLT